MQNHEKRLRDLLLKDGTHPKDFERRAMFYILSGNDDLYSKVHHIYDFQENWIIPECLDSNEIDFSSGARRLINLAFNLYNGFPADIRDVFQALDEENSRLAIEAIKLRFQIAE